LSGKSVQSTTEKRGKYFADDEEVETEVQKWLRQQSKDFYAAGFDALVKRSESVSLLVEDMSRNNFFFEVRISYVLRFITVCDLVTWCIGFRSMSC
jgi:hypothetical protein